MLVLRALILGSTLALFGSSFADASPSPTTAGDEDAPEKAGPEKAGPEKSDPELEKLGRKLKAAVKAGKITEAEAKAKWEAAKKKAGSKKGGGKAGGKSAPKKPLDLAAFERKLKAAVKAGKITEAEAKAKLEAVKKKMGKGKK